MGFLKKIWLCFLLFNSDLIFKLVVVMVKLNGYFFPKEDLFFVCNW